MTKTKKWYVEGLGLIEPVTLWKSPYTPEPDYAHAVESQLKAEETNAHALRKELPESEPDYAQEVLESSLPTIKFQLKAKSARALRKVRAKAHSK